MSNITVGPLARLANSIEDVEKIIEERNTVYIGEDLYNRLYNDAINNPEKRRFYMGKLTEVIIGNGTTSNLYKNIALVDESGEVTRVLPPIMDKFGFQSNEVETKMKKAMLMAENYGVDKTDEVVKDLPLNKIDKDKYIPINSDNIKRSNDINDEDDDELEFDYE